MCPANDQALVKPDKPDDQLNPCPVLLPVTSRKEMLQLCPVKIFDRDALYARDDDKNKQMKDK